MFVLSIDIRLTIVYYVVNQTKRNKIEKGKKAMKLYNVTFKWYDTNTWCANLAKAESEEDVKSYYGNKYGTEPIISEAYAYALEDAERRGKPVVTVPHIEPEQDDAEQEPTAADIVEQIAAKVEQTKTRSAWSKGVKNYAEWLIDDLRDGVNGGWIDADSFSNRRLLEKAMLNGANNWSQYSEGGCARICDYDIAYALCTPSELKRTDNGRKNPNPRETWIDVQSRALYQAAQMVLNAAF